MGNTLRHKMTLGGFLERTRTVYACVRLPGRLSHKIRFVFWHFVFESSIALASAGDAATRASHKRFLASVNLGHSSATSEGETG